MVDRARRALGLVALLVLAPLLAAVLIAMLLLVGVEPHSVFLPGHFVKARFEAVGVHAPNAVGVLTTVAVWWAIIVSAWLVLRLLWRRGRI
jgi:hypothetical protein